MNINQCNETEKKNQGKRQDLFPQLLSVYKRLSALRTSLKCIHTMTTVCMCVLVYDNANFSLRGSEYNVTAFLDERTRTDMTESIQRNTFKLYRQCIRTTLICLAKRAACVGSLVVATRNNKKKKKIEKNTGLRKKKQE